MSSMYQRHGILTHMMAMVLVFTMPLCCCIVNTATGGTSSCCADEVAIEITATPSCCQKQIMCAASDQNTTENPEQTPCDGDCSCTIKGAVFATEWTAPVDVIGVDATMAFIVASDIFSLQQTVVNKVYSPPKFEPYLLGFSGAPSMRGALILQV